MGNIKLDFVILSTWIYYNADITFKLGYIKQIYDLIFNTIIDA